MAISGCGFSREPFAMVSVGAPYAHINSVAAKGNGGAAMRAFVVKQQISHRERLDSFVLRVNSL